MADYTVTADTEQEAVIEAKAGAEPADKAAYIQKVFDNLTANQINDKHNNWFKSLGLATKKALYDANQPAPDLKPFPEETTDV